MSTQFFKFFIFIFSALRPPSPEGRKGKLFQALGAFSSSSRISSGVNR